MSTVEQQLYTPEDLLRMPDGDRYELVDGHLVERNIMGGTSGWIGNRIGRALSEYEDANGGRAFGDSVGYQCFPFAPDRVRLPDASYIGPKRLTDNEIPSGHIPVAPDLAVEVISPNDIYYSVENKVDEYLQAGVKMVWLVNPELRTIRIFRENIFNMKQVGPADELTGDDVLPGFSCPVAELFPKPQESADSAKTEA